MHKHVLNAIKHAKKISKTQSTYTIKCANFEVQVRLKSVSHDGFDDVTELTGVFTSQDDSLVEQKRVVFTFTDYNTIQNITGHMDAFIENQENNNLNDDMGYFEDAMNGH